MIGIILMAFSGVLEEAATDIGKIEMRKRLETPFTYGALTSIVSLPIFLVSALVRWDAQSFAWESLPALLARITLEILLAVVVIYAIKRADRSTFGFLRTLTIPFLLLADLLMGYHIDTSQIVGIALIVLALFLLFMNHGFSRHGAWLSAFAALIAVATASLYKYNITHFNSPEVEQGIVYTVLVIFFVAMSFGWERKNPLKLFRHRICLEQAALMGAGGVLGSLSFLYAAPSILMAVKRAVSMFTAVLTGGAVFHEKKKILKVCAGVLSVAGFVLLVF